MLVVEVFGKLWDDLGICLSLKLEAFAFQQCLELFVIGDDAIVDN